MKQIEITTRVNDKLDDIENILVSQGFKKIRESKIMDKYMLHNSIKVNKRNIIRLLSNCILIRYLNVEGKEYKKLTYKNKVYDKNIVISEEKINVNVDDIDKSYALLKAVNFNLLTEVNYDVIVYEKNGLELAFQNVKGLGLLLEVESTEDYEGIDNKIIIKEKKKMLKELMELGLNITNEYDVKKAYELIRNKVGE